jgi:hypothetical protein
MIVVVDNQKESLSEFITSLCAILGGVITVVR